MGEHYIMSEEIIFEPVETRDKKTQTVDMTSEEMGMLAELADHLKNSKSGAIRYAIKFCHKRFVLGEGERGQ